MALVRFAAARTLWSVCLAEAPKSAGVVKSVRVCSFSRSGF